MAKQGTAATGAKAGLSELWRRLRFVLLAIIVYRIGAHIPVPGINPEQECELEDTPAVRGMIHKVNYMVSVVGE